jgi:hypothetical protein
MNDAEERPRRARSALQTEEGDVGAQAPTSRSRRQAPATKLPDASNELLQAAQTVRDLEYMKRKTPISSPAFHVLADRIQAAARRVFALASREEAIGNEAPPEDKSIDDVQAQTHSGD